MDQQYTYYTPDQNGSQNPYREPEKKPEKKKKGAPRWVKVACLGLIFGLVASVAFQTSNLVFGRFLGNSDTASAEKTVESARLTTSSGGTAQSDVAKIAQNAMPSVVSITNMSVQQVQNFFGGVQEQEMKSAGSGIIISQTDSELLIVTNNHVVEGSDTLTVTFADEESVEANIKGTDASKDLAVIAVDLKDIKDSTRDAIAVAQMGDSDKIQVGEQAVAIGNALGYGQSVTTGIISATGRSLDGFDIGLLQTDAAINPGNSGGALLNANGEVIGINTAKASSTEVEGMGYAIPISEVSDVITNLMNQDTKKKVSEEEQGSLGIEAVDVTSDSAQMYGMPEGVYVFDVIEGGGAEKAGITKGSVITGLNGSTIDSIDTLQEQLQYYAVGTKVKLTLQVPGSGGNYKEQTVEVTLGKNTQ